ncbi:MAG TPA: sugar phosphate nucleotidyltransferase [Ignavibacteria bacterium]|nr:UDP-N-acetylglucosamine pyrophosphorylase [Bacteroidota bacterium]HRI84968.1 sugar phosphate nucleotidyltransferase [Ignavibacteria bacterium]HRJ99647.1 sugar phosphate nucleotidyltransferase [Ignavibacteria bacterium]
MKKKIAAVIMAAGKGKRMNNPGKSKVMFELKGKPLIEYVVSLTEKINSDLIIPIVGHQKQSVMDFLDKRFSELSGKIFYAHQDEQLGTGHAVMQTRELLKNFEGNVLILSGDVPLLTENTVRLFLKFHSENNFKASLISAAPEVPTGYGRVLRNEEGEFYDIREHKDCSEEELKCNEINSGIYIVDSKILFEAINTLSTDNAQGEYYLTDIFKYFSSKGIKSGAFKVNNITEITGVNSAEQLSELEMKIQ